MNFMVTIAAACVFVAVAARSIKAVPLLWYGLALAVDGVYVYGIVYSLPPALLHVLSVLVQRGTFATALFVIVMYCGVFPERSVVQRRVGSIRGELSIIACILVLAHCLNYLNSYVGVLLGNVAAIEGNQLASLAVALVLLVLLLALSVTSIKAVKHRMKASTWKSIQRSSYVFFALIYVHELLILYPAAVKGSGDALLTCIVSGVVFVGYLGARIAVYFADRKKRNVRSNSDRERKEESGVYHNQA